MLTTVHENQLCTYKTVKTGLLPISHLCTYIKFLCTQPIKAITYKTMCLITCIFFCLGRILTKCVAPGKLFLYLSKLLFHERII
jgi:hypothetical protein